MLFGGKSKLIAVIGDEVRSNIFSFWFYWFFCFLKDTVTGFLLGGIGELNAKSRKPNFLIVDKSLFYKKKHTKIFNFYLINRYKNIGYWWDI
jgi:hypothetical protein